MDDIVRIKKTMAEFENTMIPYENEKQWHKIRARGIGGSDIATIMGVNPYASVVDVYMEKLKYKNEEYKKICDKKQKRLQCLEPIRFGNMMEPVLAERFSKNHKEFSVVALDYTIQAQDHELANVDRILVNDETNEIGVLEIKTTSERNAKRWGEGNIPTQYYYQIQWYLGVTGLDFGYIVYQAGNQTYDEIEIFRDDNLINKMVDKAYNFWHENVLKQVIPTEDGTNAYSDYIAEKAKKIELSSNKIDIEVSKDDISKYENLLLEHKKVKLELEKTKQKIMNIAIENHAKIGTWGSHNFSIVKGKTKSFNAKLFKNDNETLYNKYLTEKERKPFLRIS